MLKNAECAAIIQVIGAYRGARLTSRLFATGKLSLMADADVDGAHIRCLLLTLVHRYMRPLLEAVGRVFAAVPPLHRIEVSGRGGKAGEVIYTYSDDEMRQTVARLRDEGRNVGDPVQRFKGLGEMDSKQLRETTMDPKARLLRRVTATDVEAATAVFDLLMEARLRPARTSSWLALPTSTEIGSMSRKSCGLRLPVLTS